MCAKNKQVVFAAYFPLLTANYHDYYFSGFFCTENSVKRIASDR